MLFKEHNDVKGLCLTRKEHVIYTHLSSQRHLKLIEIFDFIYLYAVLHKKRDCENKINNFMEKQLLNQSSSNTGFSLEMDSDQIAKTIAYCLLFLVSFTGNSFIVRTIFRDNRLKTSTNFLVANMAVSDLLSSFFLLPLRIIEINYNERWLVKGDAGLALCKLVLFTPDVSTAVSFYSCMFIAIDRLYAVAFPHKGGFSRSRLKFIIPGIWTFSIIIVSPYLYYFKLRELNGIQFCLHSNELSFVSYIYVLMTLNIGIPIPVVTIIYVLVVYKLRRYNIPGLFSDRCKHRRHLRNKKVLKMSVVVVSLLYFSWSFLAIFTILSIEKYLTNMSTSVKKNIQFTARFIAYLSYAYNFFIYLFFNRIYRQNFKSMMTICWLIVGVGRASLWASGEMLYTNYVVMMTIFQYYAILVNKYISLFAIFCASANSRCFYPQQNSALYTSQCSFLRYAWVQESKEEA